MVIVTYKASYDMQRTTEAPARAARGKEIDIETIKLPNYLNYMHVFTVLLRIRLCSVSTHSKKMMAPHSVQATLSLADL